VLCGIQAYGRMAGYQLRIYADVYGTEFAAGSGGNQGRRSGATKAEAAGGNRRRLLLNGGIARGHVDCVKNAEKRGKDQIRFVLSKMAYFRQRIGTAQR